MDCDKLLGHDRTDTQYNIRCHFKKNQILKFKSYKFQFVTTSKKKFFGYVEYKVGKNGRFNIATREKTIIDGLAHPEYCGGMVEVTKAMWYAQNMVDWDRVYRLGKEMGIGVMLRRLGYLLTILGAEKRLSEKIGDKRLGIPTTFWILLQQELQTRKNTDLY